MTFKNNYFRGIIDGKSIIDYKNKLDYNIENIEDRKKAVEQLLSLENIGGAEFSKDLFWSEVWDMGICKTSLNVDESLFVLDAEKSLYQAVNNVQFNNDYNQYLQEVKGSYRSLANRVDAYDEYLLKHAQDAESTQNGDSAIETGRRLEE